MKTATIQVTLDQPRTLCVSADSMARLKAATGIDLSCGGRPQSHAEICAFVWSMIENAPGLTPQDLAPFITFEKFLEITVALERKRAALSRLQSDLERARSATLQPGQVQGRS